MTDDHKSDPSLECMDLSAAELSDLTAGIYRRGGDEFSRFIGFSDGVFGFAMTLLISTVVIPAVNSENLGAELKDEIPDLLSYFVSFAVIGHYWIAHHRMFSAVHSVTLRIMRLNLAYMGLIAFMPFPTALFGRYTEEPISLVIYASALMLASVIQALMFFDARRSGLLRVSLDDRAARVVMTAELIPGAVFAISIVVAVVAVEWAPYFWFLVFPSEWLISRRAPKVTHIFG